MDNKTAHQAKQQNKGLITVISEKDTASASATTATTANTTARVTATDSVKIPNFFPPAATTVIATDTATAIVNSTAMAAPTTDNGSSASNVSEAVITNDTPSITTGQTTNNSIGPDVFVDAQCATPAGARKIHKPLRKRKKVVISNSSADTGVLTDSDDDDIVEKMEEGEIDEEDEEEDAESARWTIQNVAELLTDYKNLKAEVAEMKRAKCCYSEENIELIVKKVVENTFQSLKKEIISDIKKDLKIDSLQSEVSDYAKVASTAKDRTLDIENRLQRIAQDDTFSAVSEKVFNDLNTMKTKLVDYEARSRRKNIIAHGIDEYSKESPSMSLETAYELVELGCDIDPRGIKIERAHRLGRYRRDADKPRPLIINFLEYRDKENVMECRRNLPSHIRLTDDLPAEIRRQRSSLVPELIEARNNGRHAIIRYPATLVVDGQVVRNAASAPDTDPGHHDDSDNGRANRHVETDSTRRGSERFGSHSSSQQDRDRNNERQYDRRRDPPSGNNSDYRDHHVASDNTWHTVGRGGRHNTRYQLRRDDDTQGRRRQAHDEGDRSADDAPRRFRDVRRVFAAPRGLGGRDGTLHFGAGLGGRRSERYNNRGLGGHYSRNSEY